MSFVYGSINRPDQMDIIIQESADQTFESMSRITINKNLYDRIDAQLHTLIWFISKAKFNINLLKLDNKLVGFYLNEYSDNNEVVDIAIMNDSVVINLNNEDANYKIEEVIDKLFEIYTSKNK